MSKTLDEKVAIIAQHLGINFDDYTGEANAEATGAFDDYHKEVALKRLDEVALTDMKTVVAAAEAAHTAGVGDSEIKAALERRGVNLRELEKAARVESEF